MNIYQDPKRLPISPAIIITYLSFILLVADFQMNRV
jgi:hypothetical protein